MEYLSLAELYDTLEKNPKRLVKTKLLADFLAKAPAKDADKIMLLVQGIVFPKYDAHKIGVASKTVVKALSLATGLTTDQIEKSWKKTGDLGKSAEELTGKKRQHTLFSEELTVTKVFNNIRKLASIEGQGSTDIKLKTISELLTSAKPIEARYIVRTVLEDLRVGLGEGTLRDSIALAYYEESKGNVKVDAGENDEVFFGANSELSRIRGIIQEAYDAINDYGEIAKTIKEKGLDALSKLEIDPSKPLKVMLALKAKTVTEAFERVGTPCALEYKYDGFRMLIGKNDGKITIHTRRLENVTAQFPDVVELVKKNINADSFIVDGEAVGYDPKARKYVPFQNISQRIKRKYDIEQLAKEVPVELNLFDILYYDGKSTIKEPYEARRKLLGRIVKEKPYAIRLAVQTVTANGNEAEKFYKESLAAGNEGIMFKTLNAPYKPGARVGFMVKLKPIMETLDLVIIGAEWGEGKRSGWLSSFTIAAYDRSTDEYVELGKFGTGIKEKSEEGTSFEQLTQVLKEHIISEKGREVRIRPAVVVEISFEEIQKSPSYSSGYALRFPRLVRVREDRRPDEASTLDLVEQLYKGQ